MKSIKPGRGPSMLSGVGGIFVAIFGVIWTIGALSMGAPPFFAAFGIFFIAFAIIQAIYNFNNATRKNRFSILDITDNKEEPDDLNLKYNPELSDTIEEEKDSASFCPYCGTVASSDFEYCAKCGKKLPQI